MFPIGRGSNTDERTERLLHGSFGIDARYSSHLTLHGQLKEVEKLASKKGVGAYVGFVSLCTQLYVSVAGHDWI